MTTLRPAAGEVIHTHPEDVVITGGQRGAITGAELGDEASSNLGSKNKEQ